MPKYEIKFYIKNQPVMSAYKDDADEAIAAARCQVRRLGVINCHAEVYEGEAGLIYSSSLDWDL